MILIFHASTRYLVADYFFGNHGNSAGTFFMCSSYPGFLSKFLLSIIGILINMKSKVIATGPTTTHQ